MTRRKTSLLAGLLKLAVTGGLIYVVAAIVTAGTRPGVKEVLAAPEHYAKEGYATDGLTVFKVQPVYTTFEGPVYESASGSLTYD